MNNPEKNPLRVIYLEDQPRDRELVAATLADDGLACEMIDARNREEFEAALGQPNIGLILCDYTVPSYGGAAALASAKNRQPEAPFIFVSGTIGEERAVESLRSGATDYVLKDRLERLAPVVRRALREAAERHYRKGAERRIGELNLLLRAIRDIDRLIVRERDPERLLTEACRSLVQTRGYHAAWIGLTDPDSKRVAPAAHAGKGADSLAAATVTWDDAPTGQGPTGTAIRTGQPWVCQDIATDPRFEPWKAVARANELASVAAVPMIRGDRTLGAITVYSQRVGAFHGEELGLLGELAGDLAYALENIDHERRRKHAEASMERNHAEMAAIYDAIPLMICLVNSRHQVERVNRTMAEFGVSPITLDAPLPPGSLLGCIHAQEDPRGCGFGKPCATCPLRLAIARTSETGQPCCQVEAETSRSQAGGLVGRVPSPGGLRKVHLSVSTALVRLQDQPKVLVCLEDITGRKLLEQQLRQAQKMEAIGLLAGGVAHDFNNLLAIMRGNAELLLAGSEQHSEATSDGLRHIVTATERAANLTRQLLAFGRKQIMQARPLNLNDAIANLARMLKRIIGENIDLKCDYTPEPVFIFGDVGMLEQVLVNLVVNARDAITHGGIVRLATERLSLQADYVREHPEARAGEFVRLSVSDSGTGIAPENLPHIFEPFFTTKAVGKGTGLGLSIVYGVVKQHQGWIEVTSQPGAGARFDLLLPTIPSPAAAADAPETSERPRGGTERILLVEDDSGVRAITQRLLETFGYRVWKAASAREALKIWHAHAAEVELLLTDIMMPGSLTGRELAEQLCHEKPQLKVVFMSGYSADAARGETDFVHRLGGCFLQKPCASRTILETVRRCLDDTVSVNPCQ